jgi:hypothetical protein
MPPCWRSPGSDASSGTDRLEILNQTPGYGLTIRNEKPGRKTGFFVMVPGLAYVAWITASICCQGNHKVDDGQEARHDLMRVFLVLMVFNLAAILASVSAMADPLI